MIDVPVALAFTAGMVATVNPCGFPMLPAYLSFFIGVDDGDASPASRVPRAVAAAGAVSLGFLAVFTALGVPINAGVTSIYDWMPWLTVVVGVGLAGVGVALLAGRTLRLPLPHLDRGGRSRGFGSMVLFGVSYAVASLSCTLPLFLVYVAGTFERSNPLSGVLAFGSYALGMSVVLMALTVALALARESFVQRLRRALPHVHRASGALVLAVGGYLVWYGLHARDPLKASTSPAAFVEDWSSSATQWLSDGGASLGLVLAAVVAVGLGWAARRRHAAAPGPASGHPEAERQPEPEHAPASR